MLSKSSFEAEKCHLSTIQVSLALPGGSRTSVVKFNQNSAPASRSEALNQFMKLMSSLNLSHTEADTLADKLNDLQIEKLSNFVNKKLDEVEILNLLSKLSDDKVRVALKDLRDAVMVNTDNQLPTETEKRQIKNMIEVMDQKISIENIQINKSDQIDQ